MLKHVSILENDIIFACSYIFGLACHWVFVISMQFSNEDFVEMSDSRIVHISFSKLSWEGDMG